MDTKEKVFEILKRIGGRTDIQKTDSLKEDLAFDSLAMVTLLVEIEDAFEIELDESDMNPFDLITVADVICLAEKYKGEYNGKIS